MTLIEIRNGIIKLLRQHIPEVNNITGEDASQAEDNMPLIHIQLKPLSSAAAAAGHFKDKTILVDISYMEEIVTSNESIYAMLEKMDDIFKPYFRIGNRAFTCDAQMDITDDIGHYIMTMKFTDTVPFEVPEPVAEQLQVEWRK